MHILPRLVVVTAVVATATGCYHGSKPLEIDRPAPPFSVKDADHSVSLDQFRGKIVVLNFWASWCPPCVEELPSLMAMQKDLRDKCVVVLGVSVDADEADYRKFLKDHDVNFITVRDPGEQSAKGMQAQVSSQYGTYEFPETYVIDRNGVIRRKMIGAVNFKQQEIIDYLTRL